MTIRNNIRRLNRVLVILLLPVLIFLFLAGWSLYCIGNQRRQREIEPASPEELETMMAIFLEEQLEIEG